MPATAVTDKLLRSEPRWSGKVGTGGVASAVVTTIPLNSSTNLTNGAIYIFTLNRVDSAGVKNTLSEMETVIGELSGSNFINCVRGVEGTAQPHDADIVVEVLFTSAQWNKMVEWAEAEHNQDGTHKGALVTTLKATGAEINTGTEDAKIVTPKAIADSGLATETYSENYTETYVDALNSITTETSSATPTPTGGVLTNHHSVTALAVNATVAAPSGTPANANKLIVRIKDDGTARTLAWNVIYAANGIDLPTTTVISKTMYVGFIYDSAASKWKCVAVSEEA